MQARSASGARVLRSRVCEGHQGRKARSRLDHDVAVSARSFPSRKQLVLPALEHDASNTGRAGEPRKPRMVSRKPNMVVIVSLLTFLLCYKVNLLSFLKLIRYLPILVNKLDCFHDLGVHALRGEI